MNVSKTTQRVPIGKNTSLLVLPVTAILPATLVVLLALNLPAAAQKAGDSVTTEVFAKLDWIKGTAPKEWEPDKLYIIECWATWCGPCIASIPHVDALYDKYESKGLRVIGVNVWEDGKAKVEKFVKKKGDGMSYPVAYTGKGGAFETEWLKPGGITGIPYSFVVMNGKVLLIAPQFELTEKYIKQLLSGPEGVAEVIESMAAIAKRTEFFWARNADFIKARETHDIEGMNAALIELKKLPDPKLPDPANLTRTMLIFEPTLELEIVKKSGDWKAVEVKLDEIKDDNVSFALNQLLIREFLDTESQAPMELRKSVATRHEEILGTCATTHPYNFLVLSRLQWANGDKEDAIATIESQIERFKQPGGEEYRMLVGPYEQVANALKDAVKTGTMPSKPELKELFEKAQNG